MNESLAGLERHEEA